MAEYQLVESPPAVPQAGLPGSEQIERELAGLPGGDPVGEQEEWAMSQAPPSATLDSNGLAQTVACTHHGLAAQAARHFLSKGRPPC